MNDPTNATAMLRTVRRRNGLVAVLAALLMVAGLATAVSAAPAKPQHGLEQRNKQVVQRASAALAQGNLDELDRYIAVDYIQHRPGVPGGLEGVKQFFGALHATYPDLQITLNDIAAEGDRVWARYTFTGTLRGTDTTFTMATMDIFRVHRGRIAEHWDVIEDPDGMLQHLWGGPS